MAFYGRGWSSNDSDLGNSSLNSQNQRATVFGTMPEHGWGYNMGARLGVWYLDPGTSNVRLGIWRVDGSLVPAERLGYTALFNVTNEASFNLECTLYESAIVEASQAFSPTDNAVMLWSGERYALGWSHAGNSLAHQMEAASVTLYRNSHGSSTPTDPFSSDFSSTEGYLTVFIEYEPNVAPSVPTGLAPTGTINTLTPTFTTTFADSNSDRGDSLKQMQLEVRQGSTTGTLKWNPTIDGEDNVVYGGSALAAGTTYFWRARHSDQFGAWSGWTAWQSFTVNGGGIVLQPSTPTGKQETVTPGPFVAQWDHNSGLSTNAVEIRIKQGSTVVRGPVQIAKTVADLANISITWAETGFAALSWGTSYSFEIRARDTGNLWSGWSTGRTFNTNAYPTVPTSLSPANSQAVSARPKLTCIASDPDDTTATGLTVSARIKNNAGTVLQTRTMTFNSGTGKWEYQTIAADLASFATYKWDARSGDGTLFSNYSAEAVFAYGSGPAVTGTYPTEGLVLTTNTPVITWTATGQVKYRVQIYRSDDFLVYDTGLITSAAQSHAIPSGFLFNNTSYYYIVTVENSVPLQGSSLAVNFSTAYPAPTVVLNFLATPMIVGTDTTATAILLSWEAAENPPADFVEYIIWRKDLSTNVEIILARLTSIQQVTFVDYLPASNVTYEYSIAKTIIQGSNEETTSARMSSQSSITIPYPLIVSANNGGDYRATLRLLRAFSIDHRDDISYVFTWGDEEPTAIVGPVHYHVLTGVFDIITDQYGTAENKIRNLRNLKQLHEVVCYRDERGQRVFGFLNLREDYGRLGAYVASLTLTETNFEEGTD